MVPGARRATQADVIAHFDQLGNDPRVWRVYAMDLHHASVSLSAQWHIAFEAAAKSDPYIPAAMGMLGPAVMLRAMACECFLKAIGLQRGKFALAVGGRFNSKPAVLKQHNLVALAKLVDFLPKNETETAALHQLSKSISAGRYPIPMDWKEAARLTSEGAIEILGASGWDSVGNGLIERLINASKPTASST